MNPSEFVNRQLLAGKRDELCRMLQKYKEEMPVPKGRAFDQYTCLTKLLLFVHEALQQLEIGKNLYSSENTWLSVWQTTGYFGIDREEIQKHLDSECEQRK